MIMVRTETLTPEQVFTETFFGTNLNDVSFTERGGYRAIFNDYDELVDFDYLGEAPLFEVPDGVDFYDQRFVVRDIENDQYMVEFFVVV